MKNYFVFFSHLTTLFSGYFWSFNVGIVILGSALDKITASLCDLKTRLDSRTCVAPDVFAETMKLREDTHLLGKNIIVNIHKYTPKSILGGYNNVSCIR